MKKFYKIVCSNCNKGLGTLISEDKSVYPFLLPNDIYDGNEIKSLVIGDDFKSSIYCSNCADMRGKDEPERENDDDPPMEYFENGGI